MSLTWTISQDAYNHLTNERSFYVFTYRGFYCAIVRGMMSGNLCGYVAVHKDHPLYGKDYNDKVVVKDIDRVKFNNNYIGWLCLDPDEASAGILPLDMFIDVHCGLTYADDYLYAIGAGVLPDLWWFGFDTSHAGDQRLLEMKYAERQIPRGGGIYRDYDYVYSNVCKLADQLIQFMPPKPLFDIKPFLNRLEQLRLRLEKTYSS